MGFGEKQGFELVKALSPGVIIPVGYVEDILTATNLRY